MTCKALHSLGWCPPLPPQLMLVTPTSQPAHYLSSHHLLHAPLHAQYPEQYLEVGTYELGLRKAYLQLLSSNESISSTYMDFIYGTRELLSKLIFLRALAIELK